jgi:hypothetical protein
MMGKSYLMTMILRSYSGLKEFLHYKTEQEQMEEYLSQAENNVHLEVLQRRWDKGYRI